MKRLVMTVTLLALASSAALAGQQSDLRGEVQSALKASGVFAKCQQMMTDHDHQRLYTVVESNELDAAEKQKVLRSYAKRVCGNN